MADAADPQPNAQELGEAALQARFEQAARLHRQGRLAEAEPIYREVLRQQPDHFDALHLLGVIAIDTRRAEDGAGLIKKAIALNGHDAFAHNNLGKALLDLKRPAEALASCDRAIELAPDFAMAHNNRGKALADLGRLAEALASYDRAIARSPDDAAAHSNRGAALSGLSRSAEALVSYDKAIALEPANAVAHYNRGKALDNLKRYRESFQAYEEAYALQPDLIGAEGDRLHARMRLCDWREFDAGCAHLLGSVRDGKPNAGPFVFVTIQSSPGDQLQCGKVWLANTLAAAGRPAWQGERYRHQRIRVAYLSSDFHEHATAFLIAGMFECHDKSKFETTAISWGPDDGSDMRRRLKASFDRFVDARSLSDDAIADLIKSLEIDLLVDLKGFTQGARTGIFARRVAPVQVSYLGFPGTMGAPFIDYIVADRTVIPQDRQEFYAERIVWLPGSYQANDGKRAIADKAFARSELGLPAQDFVFCCFNSNYKITPPIFDCWMRLLARVEGSVLWLLEDNAWAAANLKNAAAARGVDAARLVFAKRMPLAEHLARHRSANLFLDTLPCNAHTTASDALWAGLPVLTCLGDTFAGRVAASLLNAVGLPEMIAATLGDYERIAADLATHPERLAKIRRKLADNRRTAPLFDTKRFTKRIEAAYIAMHERYQAGLPPDHIAIAEPPA